MSKYLTHPITTTDSDISPRVEGQRAYIGQGLIWYVIQILTCIVVKFKKASFYFHVEKKT